MKKYLFALVLRNYFVATLALLPVCPAAFAADDCPGNSGACSAGITTLSPFLEASRAENTAAQAVHAPAKKTRGAVKPADAVAAVAASSSAVTAERPAEGGLSSPAWLILVFSGFAGLYFYLRGGSKKRRRK